jgi:hypothetical protein
MGEGDEKNWIVFFSPLPHTRSQMRFSSIRESHLGSRMGEGGEFFLFFFFPPIPIREP